MDDTVAAGHHERDMRCREINLSVVCTSLGIRLHPRVSPLLTPNSRLTLGNNHDPSAPLPKLRDLDQPFPFDIRMYNRSYRFEFYDTASSENYTLLKPAVLIMCYSIADPESLSNLRTRWKLLVESHFNYNEELPVVVLGLKRDIRQKEDYDGRVRQVAPNDATDEDTQPINGRTFVYPQEALRISQEMRCDRYCECSALTGELCREVFEDIAKTAAKTTTEKGGKTAGMECSKSGPSLPPFSTNLDRTNPINRLAQTLFHYRVRQRHFPNTDPRVLQTALSPHISTSMPLRDRVCAPFYQIRFCSPLRLLMDRDGIHLVMITALESLFLRYRHESLIEMSWERARAQLMSGMADLDSSNFISAAIIRWYPPYLFILWMLILTSLALPYA
nr:rho-related gtp-binding protein rhoa-a [Quercus suber]